MEFRVSDGSLFRFKVQRLTKLAETLSLRSSVNCLSETLHLRQHGIRISQKKAQTRARDVFLNSLNQCTASQYLATTQPQFPN